MKLRSVGLFAVGLVVSTAILAVLSLLLATTARATRTGGSGTFSLTGSMNVARAGHTSTLLNTGEVLVAGGTNRIPLTSAELYNPAIRKWRLTGSMSDGHLGGTATLLQNGEVLVAGGSDQFATIATAELFNPATGTCTLTGTLSTPRVFHTATLLPDGRVLVAGGETFTGGTSLSTAEIYDPATGTWQATGNLNVARDSALAELLSNGQVLIAGGETSSPNSPAIQLASAELFDPSQGRWTFTGSLPRPAQGIGLLLANGDVLDSFVAFYSAATGNWTSVGAFSIGGGSTVTLLTTGKALYTGFRIFTDRYCRGCSSDEAVLYDFSTNSYAFTGSLITPRYADAAVLLPNGQVLVSGGVDQSQSGFQYLSRTELYTP